MSGSVICKIETKSAGVKTLMFSLRSTAVAQKWMQCLEQANRESCIRENRRFYNFPNQNQTAVIADIKKNIQALNQVFPNLIPYQIDTSSPQESVNRIHQFFADTEIDKTFVNPRTEIFWNDLNNALHAYESSLRSGETEKLSGIPEANIVVTYENNFRLDLEGEDYKSFTVAKKFGTCYVNYCQIGRHLYEMFLSQDDVARDEHILPLRYVSADTYIWLGSTTGPQSLKKREDRIQQWFEKHKERLNSLGFYWGDPKLAMGWIPVADLVPEILDLQSQLDLLTQLRDPQCVKSFNRLL
jgi:hypothetical protein